MTNVFFCLIIFFALLVQYEDDQADSQGNESDDSDVPDELKQDYIDEHTEDQQHAR